MARKSKAFDHSKYASWIDPAAVTPYERNAKQHTDKQVQNIVNSINRFGWQQDVVITADNVLVIGHGRRLAALQIGCEMPYHVIDKTADELTDEDIRELRIADNQTNAETGMDWDALEAELADLSFDGFDFDFDLNDKKEEGWFERQEKDGAERQEGNDEYNDFLDKFETKKTTDDCYTPDNIYNAVADYVADRYKIDRSVFIRPFYPGGDYQNEKYPKGCAVVDNPPFSIMAEIIRFYQEKGIRFFLFAPSLACFNYIIHDGVTVVGEYSSVTYENGANVKTSFLTNMEGHEIAAFSDVRLFEAIEKANDENEAAMRVSLPKYEYPDEVITSAKMGWLCQYGQAITIRRDESKLIRALDAQKEQDKAIFGCGLLLSTQKTAERAAAERAAAERAAATKWQLSEREKKIVQSLGKREEELKE